MPWDIIVGTGDIDLITLILFAIVALALLACIIVLLIILFVFFMGLLTAGMSIWDRLGKRFRKKAPDESETA